MFNNISLFVLIIKLNTYSYKQNIELTVERHKTYYTLFLFIVRLGFSKHHGALTI